MIGEKGKILVDDQTNQEWRELIQSLNKLIERDFGKRCDDFSPLCAVCIMWRLRDDLADIVDANPSRESDR